jgi:hypothetical protein
MNIRNQLLSAIAVIAITTMAYSVMPTAEANNVVKVSNPASQFAYGHEFPQGDAWYICINCCKTKKSSSSPWENGCRKSTSGTHQFWYCGKAGDFNYTCRSCDAEVYLTSGQSPAASKCCASGTHDWYHR